jgi:hypothetical protein
VELSQKGKREGDPEKGFADDEKRGGNHVGNAKVAATASLISFSDPPAHVYKTSGDGIRHSCGALIRLRFNQRSSAFISG